MVGTGRRQVATCGIEAKQLPRVCGPHRGNVRICREHAVKVLLRPGGWRPVVLAVRSAILEPGERFRLACCRGTLAVCPRVSPVVRYALSSPMALPRPTISLMGARPSIRTASLIPASHTVQDIPTFGMVRFYRENRG